MKRSVWIMLALLLAMTMVFTACVSTKTADESASQDTTNEEVAQEDAIEEVAMEEGALPEVNPLEVTGPIVTAGSSTVYPLSEAMAERFTDEGYADNITIDSIGSGAGFERFCVAGESDVTNASRAIKDKEVVSCNKIGRDPLEFRVGTDALAVVVSKENNFITDITMEELAQIFTVDKWSDVNAEWPEKDILRFIPGTDSGTFDFFVEEVFDKDQEPILSANNVQLSEDDNVLVQGIESSPYTVGFFGYAYYQENADVLNIANIDSVEPSATSVEDGTYPIARPLFIYSDANIIAEKTQVGAFINFYLTYVDEEIKRVGYFPASDEAMQTARDILSSAMGQ